ncbi:hypothetical protein JCM10908_007117 [Rhodotorula pacifica]|uniref:Pml1p n=1 Tax=Rhodotorula pacifica TaxID=1495444 RepID=UPI003179AC37
MADRDRYGSGGASSRRRSASPPPSHATSSSAAGAARQSGRSRYDDRDDYDRSRRREDYDRRGGDSDRRPYDDDRRGGYSDRRGSPRGEGRYHDRDQGRRRSRSPPPPAANVKEGSGGDGGWGRRDRSGEAGGGGSSSLPDQNALVPGGGGGGRDRRGGSKDLAPPAKPVEPDFKPSGALAAETNTLNGVVLKYAEPPEARKPVRNWRLYVFKGKEQVELFHVHRQSAYLIGRDRIVADIPVDHPSASKQHAVLQFRQVIERNEFGDSKSLTKPFIIDLESANGTMVNDEAVPASRFYELRSGDVLKFAFSTREYVLLVES